MKRAESLIAVIMILTIVFLGGCDVREYEKVTPTTAAVEKPSVEYTLELSSKPMANTKGLSVSFIADKEDKYFYINNGKNMDMIFLSGVNIGLTEATTDLGNPNVSYYTYMEWFKQISEMNANTVRVFTEMPPQFYKAFYDFNTANDSKLYLIHGIWFNEGYMEDPADCWDDEKTVITAFKRSVCEVLDIVHGNANGITYGSVDNAVYDMDISRWVAGYILGLEWSNNFIINSNSHKDIKSYSGKYLKTAEGATAFECFLAEVGDTLIERDTELYNTQAPVAFLNWFTNDTLTHENEPYREEDTVSVNTENIRATEKYVAGCYAALDIYPYYPGSMNYQEEYCSFIDELTGKPNNYKGYLNDLKKEYSVPVMVAEFGLPTSRGMAADSVLGYKQGNITEDQQGEYVSNMLVDIASSGYTGGLIFSWQDEWFKRTWNTYRYIPEDTLCRTPDRMSAEQSYGILAMEPGERAVCTVDGRAAEWNDRNIVLDNAGLTLYTKYDEGYLYLCIKSKIGNISDNRFLIPVSIKGIGSTSCKSEKVSFDRNTDFVIIVDGKDKSEVVTDIRYDYFEYRYGFELGAIETSADYGKKDSGVYTVVRQFVSNEQYLPKTGETIPLKVNESGKLLFGTSDTEDKDYNSLSDFCFKGNVLELRLPWSMLNVLNITEGKCFGDFEDKGEVVIDDITEIYIGADKSGADKISLLPIGYKKGTVSGFHTRLKRSYEYIKNTNKMLFSQ